MRKRNYVFVITLTIVMLMLIPFDGSYAASKRKTYPEVDMKCDNYKYVTDFPEIIMTTKGEENGLIGNCYTITGTVKGVYSSVNKAIKALGKKDAIKNSDTDVKTKCIVVKTAKGYVLVHDYYSYAYEQLKDLFGEDLVNEYYKEKGYSFKKYKKYPKKGEKVTILATYTGYSSVADIPCFNYGISPEVVSITKGSDGNDDSAKQDEKKLYKYNRISFDYPKSWDYINVNENNDDIVYFYPYAGGNGMMMLCNTYDSYGYLFQFEADEFIEGLGNTFADFKITASKKNEYKGKKIDTYYIYSFKCSIDSQKCKGRITLFTYNYRDYAFIYLCPTDNTKMDALLDDYTNIIKSIKAN